MMPVPAAAIGMKLFASNIPGRFGYRRVMTMNTVCIGTKIALYTRALADGQLPQTNQAMVIRSFHHGFLALS